MRRRIVLLGAAASAVLAATGMRAQQLGRQYRIAVLFSVSGAYNSPYRQVLADGLARHGLVEGKNVILDARHSAGVGFKGDHTLLGELLRAKPDAILALTASAVRAALALTHTVPVVFAWVSEPESLTFIRDYARPGGNATGVSDRFQEVAAKRLEFLCELLPQSKRVVLAGPLYLPELEAVTASLRPLAKRLRLDLIEASTYWDTQVSAVEAAIAAGADGLMPLVVYSAVGQRIAGEQVARLAAQKRIPAIFAESEIVDAGGLMSYGTSLTDSLRRAADMLAAVLRGARPGEMPVDQASRFELAINMKVARTMALKIPHSLLVRADRVIE